MRAAVVIGLVLLAGGAWAAAFGAETRLPNGRYALGTEAVARAMAADGVETRAEQVELPGSLSSAVAAPALRVTGAEVHGDGVLVVRMRCATAAECMPFFAEVRMGDRAEAERARDGLRSAAAAESVAGHVVGAGGVTVGARVRLEMADAQMRIALPGIAMDAGAPGGEVRVVSLDRRHTYRGVVVDAGTVKGGVE